MHKTFSLDQDVFPDRKGSVYVLNTTQHKVQVEINLAPQKCKHSPVQ